MAKASQVSNPETATRHLDRQSSSHEGWAAGILLALMLFAVTTSVANANWADGVWLTPYAALAGLLFGVLVTRLHLPEWLAHPLMLLEGAFITALLSSTLVIPYWATWNEKMVIMETRLGRWLSAVLGGGTGTDAMLFVMLLCALAWLVGYLAAWSVFREHEPWGAILPAGAALLLNLFYAPPQTGLFLMVFLLCAMLLLVRTTLLRRQDAWRRMSIRFASDIGYDFLTYGVVFSGIIILASWLVPPSAPGPEWFSVVTDRVRGPWQDLGENMSRMFSTVRNVNTGGPTTLFGSSLSMGGPIHLGVRPVLNIYADSGRYWRAVAFDRYTSSGWVNSVPLSEGYAPYDPRMQPPPISLGKVMTQTVQILLPGDNYAIGASEPFQISEATDARFALVHVTGDQVYQDITSLRLQRAIHNGDAYTVVSETSNADEESLRAAPTIYPEDIRERYLALPTTVPARVRELALKITAGADNNYDKARAIEKYLRENIKYDESVAAPPFDVDAVDYLLFERPAGYCNYYASAMAVLAREVGIPARVASGYSVGDSEQGVFHVNEGNAHSWPELYFGKFGWIEFEPTSSKPEIVRPIKLTQAAAGGDDSPSDTPQDVPRGGPQSLNERSANPPASNRFFIPLPAGPVGIAVGAGAGTLLIVLLIAGIAQLIWTQRMQFLSPAARAWEEMYRFARWAGFQERTQATPFERAEELARVAPDARPVIAQVTDWYVRERYGKQTLSPEELERAERARAVLSKRMLRGAWENIFGNGPRHIYREVRGRFGVLKKRSSTGDELDA